MEYPNIADGDSVAHEVQVNLHMIRLLMLDGVGGEIHGADVVVVDERALGGARLSPDPVLRRSTGLSLTAWRRRPGYDSSWLSSIARSLRARSSTASCISPPTPFSISGRSMWRSTCTSFATGLLGDVRVLPVPTTSQFADIFTKGLPSSTFSEFHSNLNVAGG